jgi:DNA gyrase subunit A
MATPVYVASDGRALAAPGSETRDYAPIRLDRGELAAALSVEGNERVHVFTEAGLCYGASLFTVPRDDKVADGAQLVELIEGDRVAAVSVAGDATHYALVTEAGALKRLEARALARVDDDGTVAFRLGNDRVVAVVPHRDADDVLVSTANGKLLRIELATVRPIQTADAGGVAGIALAEGDRVVSAAHAAREELLVLHDGGSAKRVPLADYPRKGRATGGVASASADKPTRRPAGRVAGAWPLDPRGTTVFSRRGRLVRVDPAQIELGTRATVSKPWITFAQGDEPRGVVHFR